MQIREEIVQQLLSLTAIPSPSGFTAAAENYLMKTLTALGFTPRHDRKGTVVCCLGGEGRPILLSAHVDTLGAMVRSVKSNGRLRFTTIGGLSLNAVETENCTVYTRDGHAISGTFQCVKAASHVYGSTAEMARNDENLEIVLDEMTTTKAETEALGVCPGDFVAVDPRTVVTPAGFIKSRHLDDKASSAVLLTLAKAIAGGELTLSRKTYIMFTVFEEVGHGASAGVPEDVEDVLAVDMGCVGDDLSCTDTMLSICAKDSAGPYHYKMTSELVAMAKALELPYAVDVYPHYSSDCATMLRGGHDARFALIGPGVYASHGYERTHLNALEATYLLAACMVSC